MDRKMDSGVLDEGESLDEEYDVTRSVLPEEILGIIDQLLCLEVGTPNQYFNAEDSILISSADGMASWIPFVADSFDERLYRCSDESLSDNHK